jgi:D-alanyl-D-alanine carboxypeptidase (penicillin-binding protein 5/6)
MKRVSVFLALALTSLAASGSAERPVYDGEAPVAFMYDMSSGAVLFSRDADRRIPPASMAKMMTAHVAFSLVDEGEIALDDECTVRPETWRQWHGPSAGSTMFLSPGEQVSIENLLYGVVTVSGNDASVVLAECISGTETAFTALMNRKAEELGLENSHFGNATGWPDEGRTYVTARDLARLAVATIRRYPEMYSQFYGRREFTWGETMDGEPITQPNRNPIMGRVNGADGLKTGHTQEAGFGFTGSAEQEGRRLVMVVARLNSFNQRISESVRFMEWGFNAWQSHRLLSQGGEAGTAQVQGGDAGEVALIAPRDLAVTTPAGLASGREVLIRYQGPIQAPIAEGQHIADLIVRTPGMPEQRMPLVAGEEIGERGFFGRVWAGFLSLIGLG